MIASLSHRLLTNGVRLLKTQIGNGESFVARTVCRVEEAITVRPVFCTRRHGCPSRHDVNPLLPASGPGYDMACASCGDIRRQRPRHPALMRTARGTSLQHPSFSGDSGRCPGAAFLTQSPQTPRGRCGTLSWRSAPVAQEGRAAPQAARPVLPRASRARGGARRPSCPAPRGTAWRGAARACTLPASTGEADRPASGQIGDGAAPGIDAPRARGLSTRRHPAQARRGIMEDIQRAITAGNAAVYGRLPARASAGRGCVLDTGGETRAGRSSAPPHHRDAGISLRHVGVAPTRITERHWRAPTSLLGRGVIQASHCRFRRVSFDYPLGNEADWSQ